VVVDCVRIDLRDDEGHIWILAEGRAVIDHYATALDGFISE
jgi:hypothetical protein